MKVLIWFQIVIQLKTFFYMFYLRENHFLQYIQNTFKKYIKKNPACQAFTGFFLKVGNVFIKLLKGTIQQMNSTYNAIDEWIDKVKRCFIRATIQGVDQNQFKNILFFFFFFFFSEVFQQLKNIREKKWFKLLIILK